MLKQKSAEFNIELNAKDKYGTTAFHLACENGHSKVSEMLIQKSAEVNITLGLLLQFFSKSLLYQFEEVKISS